jgi:tetratricopeptide (TPR) repeat protein
MSPGVVADLTFLDSPLKPIGVPRAATEIPTSATQHQNQNQIHQQRGYPGAQHSYSVATTVSATSTNVSVSHAPAGAASTAGSLHASTGLHSSTSTSGSSGHATSNTNTTSGSSSVAAAAAAAAVAATEQARFDLTESPVSRGQIKTFLAKFREAERAGYRAAREVCRQYLEILPQKVHWRVFLELADLAKRENFFKRARRLYHRVTRMQPYASQGWLDSARMEEECGELDLCERLLSKGIAFCPGNEALLVKGIKHRERRGNLPAARALLAKLKNVPIEKAWRIILEGAQLEARSGNTEVARKIFKFLMKHVPWYGPIYHEAFRFEERAGDTQRALFIIKAGLKEIPRYGPLWFAAFRLFEATAVSGGGGGGGGGGGNGEAPPAPGVPASEHITATLDTTRETYASALRQISRELLWKCAYEHAQMEERAGRLDLARAAYARSAVSCSANLRWKVWLGGARTELSFGNEAVARKLLTRALADVPAKMKASVYLDLSRLEEFVGDVDAARGVLAMAREEARHEWKIFLESVLVEMRAGDRAQAVRYAEEALAVHPGTGRLWAALIRLKREDGEDEQIRVFKKALLEVPKSGEVWTEGARLYLNPLSRRLDFAKARTFLDFAVQFTPQYGDSFLEVIRLELLVNGLDWECAAAERACVNADPNYGALWFCCKAAPLMGTREVFRNAKAMIADELSRHWKVYQRAALYERFGDAVFADAALDTAGHDFTIALEAAGDRKSLPSSLAERKAVIYGCDALLI